MPTTKLPWRRPLRACNPHRNSKKEPRVLTKGAEFIIFAATMKQRVLIVTKFYYRRGGDCVCALNLERLLRDNGHEVAVFAMQYPENEPSEWSGYWVKGVDFGGGAKGKLQAVKRILGYAGVKPAFRRILDEFKPDVVHLHNIHSYLSPEVARIAHKRGLRVVWTLHDYKLLCPSYACLRDGKPCELCYDKKLNVVRHRCMKGSAAASAVAWLEAKKWHRGKLQRYTGAFICPSEFMAGKMAQGGFDKSKLVTLSNYIEPSLADAYAQIQLDGKERDYYCYIGRLSPEKGVATLLEAASQLPYKLKVAGDGPLAEELRSRYAECGQIEFLGRISGSEVLELLSGARLSVLPSEWYENNPLGVIESLSAGVPVVGAQIGGIPELIAPGSGLTYPAGDAKALAEAITEAWTAEYDREAIRTDALSRFSPAAHYRTLLTIYK